MDSAEYSGLRQYLLNQKPRKDRVHRELWESNGATYHTYRKYLNHVRQFGFPDDMGLQNKSNAQESSRQRTLNSSSDSSQRSASFSGVEAVIEGCHSPVTVMSYGYLSNSLIAFGTLNGGVWTLTLDGENHKLNKVLDYEQEVRDIDWSLDNSLLLSCSLNGCVCLSGVDPPSIYRKWRAKTRTTCCKFHWLNQNLVMVGGGGSLYVFNCSTGAQVQRITITASPSTYLTALACTNSQICLGDSTGILRTYKSTFKNNVLQLTAIGSAIGHPYGRSTSAVTGIDIRSYSSIYNGTVMLCSYQDSSFAIYKTTITATPRVELCTKLAMRAQDRRVKAIWCPTTNIDEPEYIAVGGEHANVHIYSLASQSVAPILASTLSVHESPVFAVCWSFDGHGLTSGDENGSIVIWHRITAKSRVSCRKSCG